MANLVTTSIQQLLEKAIRANKHDKARIGTAGEEAIVCYITQKGWNILARNWRPKGVQHGLELDIVATDKGTLVFVEVKTRTSTFRDSNTDTYFEKKGLLPVSIFSQMQLPFFTKRQSKEAITCVLENKDKNTSSGENYYPQGQSIPAYVAFTQQKRQKMLRAAQYFLSSAECYDVPCRFDLFCIDEDNKGKFWIEHYEHVIETGKTLDSRNTYWEPW